MERNGAAFRLSNDCGVRESPASNAGESRPAVGIFGT
jgi:hypothetical protein